MHPSSSRKTSWLPSYVTSIRTEFLHRAPTEYIPSPLEMLRCLRHRRKPINQHAVCKALSPVIQSQLDCAQPRGTGKPRGESVALQPLLVTSFRNSPEGRRVLRRSPGIHEYVRKSALVLGDLGFKAQDLRNPVVRRAVHTVLIDRYLALVKLNIAPTIFKKRAHLLNPTVISSAQKDAEVYFATPEDRVSPARTVFTLVCGGVYKSAFDAYRVYTSAYNKAIRLGSYGPGNRSIAQHLALLVMLGRYESAQEALAEYKKIYAATLKVFRTHPEGECMVGTIAAIVHSGSIPTVAAAFSLFTSYYAEGLRLCEEKGFIEAHVKHAVRLVLHRVSPNLELALEYLSLYVRVGRRRYPAREIPTISFAQFLEMRKVKMSHEGGAAQNNL